MTEPTKVQTEFVPLDQIRQTEAEVTRQIAAARESAALAVEKTRSQAKEIIAEAREAGKREGLSQYKEICSTAEEEAQAIIIRARKDAENLSLRGNHYMERGIRHAVNIILGVEKGISDV
jgi:vacuolar-type H+-ATPase subunit H